MSNSLMTWEEAVQWLRAQPDQQELVENFYYDDPLVTAVDRFSTSPEWLSVQQLLQPYLPGDVLDLGAGRCISSYAFAQSGSTVTALEPDSSQIVGAGAIRALVEQTQLPIQIVQEYGETLPFPNQTFDVVYGRAVLHHARDLKQLCQDAARVLKPGGAFLATREHVISRKADLPRFLESHTLHHLYGGENAFLLSEYTAAIEQAGLQIQQVIAPYDSVINHGSPKDLQSNLKQSLSRFFAPSIAKRLATQLVVQELYRWRLSHIPGRLFSFLAVKL
jgi:ubiquinone/menaquinone biosynthesis C-methylase UbiE